MVAAAILSSVDVNRSAGGQVAIHFGFGTTALVALALIWLPAIIQPLLLTGGTVKAAGLEASATGLITRETLFGLLAQVKGVTSADEDDPTRGKAVKELDDLARMIASEYLGGPYVDGDDVLSDLARRYERIRLEMPSGPQRTSAMTRIVNEARVLGGVSPSRSLRKALGLLRSPAEGDRIVGLSLTMELGDPAALEEVLTIIPNSASAFEMSLALGALQQMSRNMSRAQRARAIEVVLIEAEDPRGVGIGQDPNLPVLIERTLDELGHREVAAPERF